MARTPQDQRRIELVAAAKRVLLADGLGALTVRRVAGEASASVAAVHYAFRDKAELVASALDDLLGDFTTSVIEPLQTCDSLPSAVERLVWGYWDWLLATPRLETVIASAGLEPPPDGQPNRVTTGATLMRDALQTVAGKRPEVDLDELAHLIVMILDGATLVYAVEGDQQRLRTSLEHAVKALRHVCQPMP